MSAEIGGQLEAVAPRRSLFGPDYLRIAVLLAVAAAVHYWLVAHTAVPARDSLGYARVAVNLSNPNATAEEGHPRGRIDVVREAEQPPGYPVAVWLTEKLLRRVTDRSLAERALLATQVANAAAAVLLVVPIYLTGRILFGRNVGFAAALVFEVLPVPARVTSDGLSEGAYLLVVAVAITLAVRAARKPGIGAFLVCGLATGASYLVRPEGLMVAMAVGCVITAAGLSRRWPRDVALGRLTALCVGVALTAVPYMVVIGKLSNKPTEGYLTNPFKGDDAPIWKGQPGANAGGGGGPLFAAWWDPAKDAGRNRTAWALQAVWGETTKSQHYAVGILALLALVAHRRQLFAPDAGMWVVLVLAAINLLLLVYLAARIGYVSERHTVLLTMLCSLLAAASFGPISEAVVNTPVVGRIVLWPRLLPATLAATVVLTALPYTLKPMHPQRVGHKHAGLWLADRLRPGDWLIDPFSWAEWYAGRTLYKPPVCHGRPEFVWVVVEKKASTPHSRLPLWERAVQLTSNHVPFYRWPADAPKDGPAVEVYRLRYEEVEPQAAAKPAPPRKPSLAPPPREQPAIAAEHPLGQSNGP